MSIITKESIADTIEGLEQLVNRGIQSVHIDMAIAGMHRLLASLEAETVAYADPQALRNFQSGAARREWMWRNPGEDLIPIFTAPPAPIENTDRQRKAAIHDALCEKYNVESLADFVEWQRNHIAELEAAPPAPVGKGETAVMPDYPGYVMTQRECFQAGKKAGLAEAEKSLVIPEGWVMVPVEPTTEMLAELCLVEGWTERALNARYQAMIEAAPQQEVK